MKKESKKTKDNRIKKALKEKLKYMFTSKYVIELRCKNCKNKSKIIIPKGTTIIEWKKNPKAVCYFCGCRFKELD